jgi:glycosyltransferase involved in cell wall biosynthesis
MTGWQRPIVTTIHEYGWWEWHPEIVPPKLLEWLKTWRYWGTLKQIISQLNLENYVHMTGYLDAEKASQFLIRADIGVLPFNHGVTLKSGSLLTLMAHRLPVIVTRSNGNNNELESAPIRMINPRDVEGLTNLLMNPISRLQLGLASQGFSRQFS